MNFSDKKTHLISKKEEEIIQSIFMKYLQLTKKSEKPKKYVIGLEDSDMVEITINFVEKKV